MLTTQVQYWTLQETKRHDLAVEKETKRHDLETENIGWSNLSELIRHNTAQEEYWNNTLEETKRHNQVLESVDWTNALTNQENAISNRMQAQAALQNAATNAQRMVNDWQLGLAANRVASFNAMQNERQATVAEQKLQLAEDVENRSSAQSWASLFNEDVRNDVSQQNADTASGTLDLSKKEFKHKKAMDIWHNVLDTVSTGVDAAETATKIYGAIGG